MKAATSLEKTLFNYYDASNETHSRKSALAATGNVRITPPLTDWSGRGCHVEYSKDETLPFKEVNFLGAGSSGRVYETEIQGIPLAWKTVVAKPKTRLLTVRKEVEVLQKLSHLHLVQLIGTYTYKYTLGILLFPVAVCDLRTFFDDFEAHQTNSADEAQKSRLQELGYVDIPELSSKASIVYKKIGCLITTVAYLHSHRISVRHKDIKPSNILLTRDGIYLSDFGSATDFSELSNSATDRAQGTLRYCAPEMARQELCGRAADIFSLGCVLLEMLVLHNDGTLRRLRANHASNQLPMYHQNLDKIDSWLPLFGDLSPRRYHIHREVRQMLSHEAENRPSIDQILSRIYLADAMMAEARETIFCDYCQASYKRDFQPARQVKMLQKQKSLLSLSQISHIELQEQRLPLSLSQISHIEIQGHGVVCLEQARSIDKPAAIYPKENKCEDFCPEFESRTPDLDTETPSALSESAESTRALIAQTHRESAQTADHPVKISVTTLVREGLSGSLLPAEKQAAEPYNVDGFAEPETFESPTIQLKTRAKEKEFRRVPSLESVLGQVGSTRSASTRKTSRKFDAASMRSAISLGSFPNTYESQTLGHRDKFNNTSRDVGATHQTIETTSSNDLYILGRRFPRISPRPKVHDSEPGLGVNHNGKESTVSSRAKTATSGDANKKRSALREAQILALARSGLTAKALEMLISRETATGERTLSSRSKRSRPVDVAERVDLGELSQDVPPMPSVQSKPRGSEHTRDLMKDLPPIPSESLNGTVGLPFDL